MANDRSDSLFKLRLTGALRERLEREANQRGITLTAEILRRIDDSFSEASDRISALEKVVLDGEVGNNALRSSITEIEKELKDTSKKVGALIRAIRASHL